QGVAAAAPVHRQRHVGTRRDPEVVVAPVAGERDTGGRAKGVQPLEVEGHPGAAGGPDGQCTGGVAEVRIGLVAVVEGPGDAVVGRRVVGDDPVVAGRRLKGEIHHAHVQEQVGRPGTWDAHHQAVDRDRVVGEILDDVGDRAGDAEDLQVGLVTGVQVDGGRAAKAVDALELVGAAAAGVDVLHGQGAGGVADVGEGAVAGV